MITITLKEFPTHIAKTNNKVAANKMLKINNQAIYNGYVNRFTRNIVMTNLHNYLKAEIKPCIALSFTKGMKYPISLEVVIYTVKNHGSISIRKGVVCWKPVKPTYVPNWDIENLASIWIKAINDSLVQLKIVPDDSIQYINKVSYRYVEVKELKNRKLIIKIK